MFSWMGSQAAAPPPAANPSQGAPLGFDDMPFFGVFALGTRTTVGWWLSSVMHPERETRNQVPRTR